MTEPSAQATLMADVVTGKRGPALVTLVVPGMAVPGGSKRAFATPAGMRVVDSSGERGRNWRAQVRHAADLARSDREGLLDGPLWLGVLILFARPKGHLGKRGLRRSADPYPIGPPDATKLVRAIEDALNGVLWVDDRRVVSQTVDKRYAPDGRPRVLIEVGRMQ